MDWTQIIVAAIGALGLLFGGGVLSYFFLKPKEKIEAETVRQQVEASVSQSILNIAKGTVEVAAGVTDELEAQVKRMSIEQAEQRAVARAEQEELRKLHQEQVKEEREASASFKKSMAEANEEVIRLRAALRETQAECDKWRKKYEELAAANGGA